MKKSGLERAVDAVRREEEVAKELTQLVGQLEAILDKMAELRKVLEEARDDV